MATENEVTPQTPSGGNEPPSSPTSGEKSNALPDIVALQNQVESLNGLVKSLQKGTDKQIGQVRGDIKRILELGGKGMDESQIHRELFLDNLMSTPSAPATGTSKVEQSLDVDAIVKSLQFAENDAALAVERIKHKDPQAFLAAAVALRVSQLQTPSPSGATATPQTGGVQSLDSQAELKAEYDRRIKPLRGNILAISDLQNEMRRKGLNV